MPVETHEVRFSFDQPGDARHPLLSMLQQLLNRPLARDSRATALLGSQRVLIIDSQQERGQYIAHLLTAAGYRPLVVQSSLDAYTLFLQGTFHPFAIILSEDGAANNQFFLTRLAQQFIQRYDWNVPYIRLQIPSSSQFLPRSTEPLGFDPMQQKRPTLPLNQPPLPQQRSPEPPMASPRPPASNFPNPPSYPAFGETTHSSTAHTHSSLFSSPSQSVPQQPFADSPAQRSQPTHPRPSSLLPSAPLPPASLTRFNKKQVEKISLNNLSIGRYHLKSVIGANPLGDVYLTYDSLREQDIALKTIQTNMLPPHLLDGMEEEYNLFQPELDLLQHLDHSHLVRVLSIGKSYVSGFPFVYKTMPYYKEGSLASWLVQFIGKPFPPADVARVVAQLANAVQFLHNRGLLYQNFKQTNVMVLNVTQNMRDLHVSLADLTFVHDIISLPKTSESYRYYAPEQWDNEAFTSSDQYGLAVLAYELLTGRAPFQGNSDAIMRRMHLTMPVSAPSSFNSHLSSTLDRVLLRALAKRPEERFESISAFSSTFEQAAK